MNILKKQEQQQQQKATKKIYAKETKYKDAKRKIKRQVHLQIGARGREEKE